ncbi:hypothetical protein C0991_011609 [Blastosporella zonata]|nr:hypothetical protein C0991_011609 [Blastosporella zonata]
MGYQGKFYEPHKARHCAEKNVPPEFYNPSTPWSIYNYNASKSDERFRPAQLIVESKNGIGHWSDANKFRTHMVDIREPGTLPLSHTLRTWAYTPVGEVDSGRTLTAGGTPEPEFWKHQPLLVRDPYVLTQNHTEGVSMADLARLAINCCNALQTQNNYILNQVTHAYLANVSDSATSRNGQSSRPPPSAPKPPSSSSEELSRLLPESFLESSPNPPVAPIVENSQMLRQIALDTANEEPATQPFAKEQSLREETAPRESEVVSAEKATSFLTSDAADSVDTQLDVDPKQILKDWSHDPSVTEMEDADFLAQALKRSESSSVKRSLVFQKVRKVISQRYGRAYGVEQFGSSRYGLSTENSDLDLVIIDPSMPFGDAPHAKANSQRTVIGYVPKKATGLCAIFDTIKKWLTGKKNQTPRSDKLWESGSRE